MLEDAPPSYRSVDGFDTESIQVTLVDDDPPLLNQFSGIDLFWILTGLWSAVFLGALDGKSSIYSPRSLDSKNAGTIVATLLAPIGSEFEKSNQASYIGTSYLLSVCCFTPLYGL